MSKELIDVEMPDGTVIQDVPKGTTQTEISRRYQLSQSPQPETASPALTPQQQAEAMASRKSGPGFDPMKALLNYQEELKKQQAATAHGLVGIAATNLVGEGIGALAGKYAAPVINRWLQVAPKEMEYGANPAKRLISEGLVKATKAGTQEALQPALDDAGLKLGSKLIEATAKGTKIDASNTIMDALSNATKRIGVGKDPAFQARLNEVLTDILKEYPNPSDLTPLQAQGLKKAIGDSIKWHGLPFEGDINQALVKIYGGINSAIKTAVPGADALQSRWGDLYLAARSLGDAAIKDAAGVGTGNLNPLIKGGLKTAAKAAGVGVVGEGLIRLTNH